MARPASVHCSSAIAVIALLFVAFAPSFPTATAQTLPSVNLGITKTGSSTVTRGQSITYTLAITNPSTQVVANVVAIDTPPTGFTFMPAGSSTQCQLVTGGIACSLPTVGSGSTTNLTLVFATSDSTPCGNATNTAVVSSAGIVDPDSSNNTATHQTSVVCPNQQIDLGIQMTGPQSIVRGAAIDYTLTVTNTGTANATGVTVSNPLPTGTTFSATGSHNSCAMQGSNVVCAIGTVNAGQTATVHLRLLTQETNPCTTGSVANSASVTATQTDPNMGNNQSNTVTTQLTCAQQTSTDLAINKTGPQTIVRGNYATYFVTVTNNGQIAAANVIVTDAVPAGTTFVPGSSDASCLLAGSTVSCNLGTLVAGQVRSLTLAFLVPLSTGTCQTGTLTNSATVASSTTDPNMGNNQSNTVTSTVQCPTGQTGCIEPRVEARDTLDNPMTPVPQFTITLNGSQTAVNNAAGIARFENVAVGNHTVALVVPANWTLTSVTPTGGIVSVASGGTCASVTFRAKQTVAQTPRFSISKTDGRTTVSRGETLTYTITVSNTSTVNATNIQVTDTLPNGVTFLSASDGGVNVGNIVTWTLSSIAANSSKTITLQVRVSNTVAGNTVLRNIAQVVGGPFAEDTTTVSGVTSCPIDVTLDSDEDEPAAGDELTYDVTVTNITNTAQNNVEVTLALPDEVEFIDATEDGEEEDGEVVWEVDLASFDEETFEVTVDIDADLDEGDELDAVVFVDCTSDSLTLEISEGDNGGNGDAGISIRKEASPPEVFPGGVVEYILTIENTGDDELSDITIEDRFNASLLTVIDDGNADEESNGRLLWNMDSLDGNETQVIRYRVIVDGAAFPGQIIRNEVMVEADGEEDRASATVVVIGTLPQTGVRMRPDSGSRFLRPWRSGGESSVPVAASVAVTLSGLLMGAGFGVKKWWMGM